MEQGDTDVRDFDEVAYDWFRSGRFSLMIVFGGIPLDMKLEFDGLEGITTNRAYGHQNFSFRLRGPNLELANASEVGDFEIDEADGGVLAMNVDAFRTRSFDPWTRTEVENLGYAHNIAMLNRIVARIYKQAGKVVSDVLVYTPDDRGDANLGPIHFKPGEPLAFE